MQSDGINIILRCYRLFQQYIVNAYAKIEQQRQKLHRFNQQNQHSAIYSGVEDAVLANGGSRAGRRIFTVVIHWRCPTYATTPLTE